MRIVHLWVVLVLAGAFIGPASSPIGLPDIFWTLQRGALMIDQRALLASDPFTTAPHVAGATVNPQWLADLLYAGLDRLGGLELVITANALAIAATYGLVLAAAYAASRSLRLSCLAVVVAYLLGFSNLSPRPQTLAYVLFAWFVWVCCRTAGTIEPNARMNKSRVIWPLWTLPFVMALWANIHGSFFAGWLLLGCWAIGQRSRPHALALLGCLLAALATPYGPGALVYLATISTNPIIREHVTEWAPTTLDWREGAFLFLWLAALGWLALRSRARLTFTDVLVLLVFGWLALSSVRAIVWFGLAMAPIAARLLTGLVPRTDSQSRERPGLNLAIATAVTALVAVSLPWTKQAVPFLPDDKRALIGPAAPVRAAAFLRTYEAPVQGRMLNHETWGGYLDWAVWPKHQPFLDGRIELHPPEVWLDYLSLVFPGASWRELMDQYQISYALLSQADQADLIGDLKQEPGWHLAYEDDQAAVFERAPPSARAGV